VRQTELAVLGVLGVRSMTGYAVREAIRDVLGHFWSESYGQIYPTLGALADDGLVARTAGERPGSTLYQLTPAGRERLLDLLAQPGQPTPPRNGLMLRLFFGRMLGADACRELVEQARARAVEQLRAYAAIRDEMLAEDEYADHRPFWLLTVSAGEHAARAAIAWADETLAALDTIDRPGRSPRTRG
jgi:DNA-binding PadR family transcriptional regulator